MEGFLQNSELIWFLIGLVLIILELFVPGLVLIFFGVGAWITAGVCLFTDIGINTQLFVFLINSLASLALLRKALKKRYMDRKSPDGELEDEYIGQEAVAITTFGIGEVGKVTFKGTNWEAISQQAVTTGQRLRITGYKSIRLFVEPLS